MKKNKFYLILAFVIFACICCNQKSSKQNNNQEKEFDTFQEDTFSDSGELQMVIHKFPTPGEMFGVIKEGGLTYKENLLNSTKTVDNFIKTKSQALNLGIYIADFAYLSLFGKQDKVSEYLKVIDNLSQKVQVSPAINKNLVDRIKNNIGNIDSLTSFSDDAFLDMFSYCEDNNMHNINSLISSGAYIEGLYIALGNIEKYSKENKILHQLAQQKYSFEHLLNYVNEYTSDEDVLEISVKLTEISDIFGSLDYEEKKSDVNKKNKTLLIGGGKKFKFSKSEFVELKKKVEEIRLNIINEF